MTGEEGDDPAFDDARAYCAALLAAASEGRPGDASRDLEIAGVRIRIRLHGPLASELWAPLAHLRHEEEGEPEWKLDVLDAGGETGRLPTAPFAPAAPGPGGQAYLRYQDDEVAVVLESRDGIVWAFDSAQRTAAAVIPDLSVLPAAEHDTRLRHPLQMILSAAGRPLIHSGMVGLGDTGALLPGRSGSGKSTLALGSALAGLDFCSDDYVVLTPGELRGHGLLQTAKLTTDSAGRLGVGGDGTGEDLRFEDRGFDRFKATVEVPGVTRRIRPSMRIAMLVVPRITAGGDGSMHQVSGKEAMHALAPATLVQQPTRDPLLLRAMAEIVNSVPCLAIGLSPDPAVNAESLRRAVERVRAEPKA